MDIFYDQLIELVKNGREIEFCFRNKDYSITNSEGYWYCCCDSDQIVIEKLAAFYDTEKLENQLQRLSMEGVLLQDIFNQKLYKDLVIF